MCPGDCQPRSNSSAIEMRRPRRGRKRSVKSRSLLSQMVYYIAPRAVSSPIRDTFVVAECRQQLSRVVMLHLDEAEGDFLLVIGRKPISEVQAWRCCSLLQFVQLGGTMTFFTCVALHQSSIDSAVWCPGGFH